MDDSFDTSNAPTASVERLRSLTKIAVLYFEEGLSQVEIAERLQLSQTRISRYLKQAEELGIIRHSVMQPEGIHVGLESALEDKYGLNEVIVVDYIDESSLVGRLGSSAATYLESTLLPEDSIGISSWSSTLLATVDAMRSRPKHRVKEVSQLLGGVGTPHAQILATRLTSQLAQILSAKPIYLPAPGVCETTKIRDAFLSDTSVQIATNSWRSLSTVLVGIGAFPASPMITASGNTLNDTEQAALTKAGAVGEICLRYFDADGKPMQTKVSDRILAVDPSVLLSVKRRIGVAGGLFKLEAIRAAITGGWLNVLITDSQVAMALLEPPLKKN